MQLDDRVTGLEKKLGRTTTVVYVLVALSLGLLGTNLYMVSRQNVSFDRIFVRDSIEIGDQQNRMTLDHSRLKIVGDELGEVLLTNGLLQINKTSLTGDRLSLDSGPTQLIAEVSTDEGTIRIANQSGIISANLGGGLGTANLSLLGNQKEAVSAIVGNGDAEIQVSNSKSSTELKP